ncbi:MAG: two-component system, OmpR family, response regulator [Acidobacteriota bacterium]|nr:two-component system, OmpR family, response regulator [Acidobacteriota bacterium]
MRSPHSEKDPSRDQRLRSPARALLVIDQRVLAEVVSLALNHGRYIIRVASTGQEATSAVADWSPHLVVLDMDIEGNDMLKRFATATLDGGRLPVIALTRRGDLKSKLGAFAQGVDDILTVPFSSEELVARVVAVLRRTYRDAAVFSPLLRLGDLEIDILNRRVRAGGMELHLTSLEQSLLYLLAANAGRLLTRDEILDCLWGADYVAESNVVDRHIRNLRVKLQDPSRRPRYIVTVPGRGYRFRSPDLPDGAAPV